MRSNNGSISGMGQGQAGGLTEREVWALRERVQRARGAGRVYEVDASAVERFRTALRGVAAVFGVVSADGSDGANGG